MIKQPGPYYKITPRNITLLCKTNPLHTDLYRIIKRLLFKCKMNGDELDYEYTFKTKGFELGCVSNVMITFDDYIDEIDNSPLNNDLIYFDFKYMDVEESIDVEDYFIKMRDEKIKEILK